MISQNYFDYAAATPLDPKALTVMVPYLGDVFYNPSADYLAAKQVRADINDVRKKIATSLAVKHTEIVFTAGGTEANNLVIHGVMQQYPDTDLVVSSIEHDSVLGPAHHYAYHLGAVDQDGYVNLNKLKNQISDSTVLISVMYANNEIGTIQPLKQISALVDSIKASRAKAGNDLPLYLHTDASQAGNYLSLKPHALGVDMMTINGGKIYGPKQSGLLYIRTGIQLTPQIFGGGQERGYRSGTENVAAIMGLSEALEIVQAQRPAEHTRMKALQTLCVGLVAEKIPNAVLNGGDKRLPNNVHITVPGIDNEVVMLRLDVAGFQIAAGSACSASSDEPSHVLAAIGLSENESRSSLRISMGRFTTEQSVRELIDELARACSTFA